MIGKLTGIIDNFVDNHVILDVQGVGYVVFASARTLSRIGQKGNPASLLIDTHVREDHIHLYGFADAQEQRWFRLLTSVQGVGAKVGMAILGAIPPDRLSIAIASQDKAVITQADGVGPKLALRILTELKDKVKDIDLPTLPPLKTRNAKTGEPDDLQHDAVSALVNLGYQRSEAFLAVSRAASKANDNDLQSLIRRALKEIGV